MLRVDSHKVYWMVLENEKPPFGPLNRPKEFSVIITPTLHWPWHSAVSRLAVLATSPSLKLLLGRQRHSSVLSAAAAFSCTIRICFKTQNQTDFRLLQESISEDGMIICLGIIVLNIIFSLEIISLITRTVWKHIFCFSLNTGRYTYLHVSFPHPYFSQPCSDSTFSSTWYQIVLRYKSLALL